MQFLRIGRGGKVFEQIGETEPELLNKLVVINGDVTLPKLGMSAEDTQLVISRVSVVFHVAARIKFDNDLKSATEMNVKGTQRIIDLCQQIGSNLKAFVHVSTTYIHLEKGQINEVIYPAPFDPAKFLHSVDTMEPDQMANLVTR